MKKRIAVVGISLAVGMTLLLSTAFASAQNINGYEAYKNAAENTFKNKNATINLAATISDNGNNLATIKSVMKADQNGTESFSGNTEVTAAGKTMSFENYGKDGQMVTKIAGDDTYLVSKENPQMEKKFDRMDRMNNSNTAEEERVGKLFLDAMVGDLKNNFVTDRNADGSSTITLDLQGNQLPAYINGLVGLAVKDSAHKEDHVAMKNELPKEFADLENMNVQVPDLVSDVNIKAVKLVAQVSPADLITAQTMEFDLTGKDASGVNHEIKISMNIELTGLNTTTPDTIDLTGKNVKVIEHKTMESER